MNNILGKNYIITLEGLVIQKLVTPCKLLSSTWTDEKVLNYAFALNNPEGDTVIY